MNYTQLTATLNQKFNIMCSNWLFLHDYDRLHSMPLEEYRKTLCSMKDKVLAHPMFESMVWCMIEPLNNNMVDGETIHEHFDEIQVPVHKILDMINKEEKLNKDFL